jgi:hypothetical protein
MRQVSEKSIEQTIHASGECESIYSFSRISDRISKYSIRTVAAIVAIVFVLQPLDGFARKLKVYRLPKTIAPGQMGILIFENPDVERPQSMANCNSEKLIGWVKSEIPILRFEQNGKQVWVQFGSYNSVGDSCIGSFLAPFGLEAGNASLFLVNQHDASVPSAITIIAQFEPKLIGLVGSSIQPLKRFSIYGEGFVHVTGVESKPVIGELDDNVGFSKMSPADQWTIFNRRITTEWDRLPEGDFLYLEQGEKKWRLYVEGCGINNQGLTLDFTAPPDIQPGTASITLAVRENRKEVGRTDPLSVNVQ